MQGRQTDNGVIELPLRLYHKASVSAECEFGRRANGSRDLLAE